MIKSRTKTKFCTITLSPVAIIILNGTERMSLIFFFHFPVFIIESENYDIDSRQNDDEFYRHTTFFEI